ncbi:hypothetical protein LZ554_000455 [Drepanopeziza brunnea f. sp. 'monogermtubi']|nr:hypothetical protein LZ554_000455 [Drepanopeziza brunnea f. sp. 'monogermtubi']
MAPRPKIFLMRHAEAKSKVWDYELHECIKRENLIDPKLTKRGRKQCRHLARHSIRGYCDAVTHIFSSPLSRALTTACLTFKNATARGVRIVALPELQTMGTKPNGMGLCLRELEAKYGDGGHGDNGNNGGDGGAHGDNGDNGGDGGDDGDLPADGADMLSMSATHRFRGRVDFASVPADWNDAAQKTPGSGGRYASVEENIRVVKGRLASLRAGSGDGDGDGDAVVVAVVGHSSFLKYWEADVGWDTFYVRPWCAIAEEGKPAREMDIKEVVKVIPEGSRLFL